MNGTKQIAQRIVNAENTFIESVMNQFNKNKNDAEKVLSVYRKFKIVKIDPITGQFNLKHGAFWELTPINNAINS